MVRIADKALLSHADRIKGKVTIITGELSARVGECSDTEYVSFAGGGSGIGRETALLYSKYGYGLHSTILSSMTYARLPPEQKW